MPRVLDTIDFYTKREEVNDLPLSEIRNGVKITRFSANPFLYKLLFIWLRKLRGVHRLSQNFYKQYEILTHGPFVPQMVKEVIKLKPDAMIVLSVYASTAYFAYLAKKKSKTPFIIIPCLHVYDEWAKDDFIYRIIKAADRIIALTEFEKDYYIQKGIDASLISVIGVGADCSRVLDAESKADNFKKKNEINICSR